MSDENKQAAVEVASSELFAYQVTTEYADVSEIAFAKNVSAAKTFAIHGEWFQDSEWVDLRVTRLPKADKHAARFGEGLMPFIDDAARVMRDLGWYDVEQGGYGICAKCGLYEWEVIPESQISEHGEQLWCKGCIQANTVIHRNSVTDYDGKSPKNRNSEDHA